MKLETVLKHSFLFSKIDEKTISALTKTHPPEIRTFKRGEMVYSSEDEPRVGFVLSGRCEIRLEKQEGAKTVINTLSVSDSFGILSIYSQDEFPTRIYAEVNCEIAFFDELQIHQFVNSSSQISANLIKFMANRISFLNRKIATFSGTRVQDRLAAYLLNEAESHSSLSFPFNCQKTSAEINAGRASVYRAIESFCEAGIISFDNKTITINQKHLLERTNK